MEKHVGEGVFVVDLKLGMGICEFRREMLTWYSV